MFVDPLCKVQGPTESHAQRTRARALIVFNRPPRDLTSIHGDITSTHRFHTEPFCQELSRCVGHENNCQHPLWPSARHSLHKESQSIHHSVRPTNFNPPQSFGGGEGNTWPLAKPLVRSPRVQYHPDLLILLFLKEESAYAFLRMQGPLWHVESIGLTDEAQILSVGASENGISVWLDKGVTSNALAFVDAPQHPLMVTLQICQAPTRYNVTQIGTNDKQPLPWLTTPGSD